MANKATYLGPSDVFIVRGEEYRVGDTIPDVSREELWAWMNHGGHRFDVTVERPNAQPATVEEADTERGELAASVVEASTAHVGASLVGVAPLHEDAKIVPVEDAAPAQSGKGRSAAGKPKAGSGSASGSGGAQGGAGGSTPPATV